MFIIIIFIWIKLHFTGKNMLVYVPVYIVEPHLFTSKGKQLLLCYMVVCVPMSRTTCILLKGDCSYWGRFTSCFRPIMCAIMGPIRFRFMFMLSTCVRAHWAVVSFKIEFPLLFPGLLHRLRTPPKTVDILLFCWFSKLVPCFIQKNQYLFLKNPTPAVFSCEKKEERILHQPLFRSCK